MHTTTSYLPPTTRPGRSHGQMLLAGAIPRPVGAGAGGAGSYEWISPAQAAARLRVRVRDVYRLIDAGVLPAYRIDQQIRLLAHEVDEVRRRRG